MAFASSWDDKLKLEIQGVCWCALYISISREKDTAEFFCLTTKFSDYEIRLFDEKHIKRAQHDIGGNLYFMYSCYTLESRMMMRSNKIKIIPFMPQCVFQMTSLPW